MLETDDIPFMDRPELLNTLGKMCSRLKTIPDSVRIESCLDGQTHEYGGGCAIVSRGQYRGRAVAIKTLHLCVTSDPEERFDVSVLTHRCSWRGQSLPRGLQKFRREVVAWRHLQHPNILPFIGVNLERHKFTLVSEWMEHGTITEFVEEHKDISPVQLVRCLCLVPVGTKLTDQSAG